MNKHERVWSLQEAKARFSEVVRLARSEGPQLVTVHGKVAVTIAAAAEGPSENETGASLVELLDKSPLRRLGTGQFGRSKLRARGRAIDL